MKGEQTPMNQTFKRITTIGLALLMMFTIAMPVFAAEEGTRLTFRRSAPVQTNETTEKKTVYTAKDKEPINAQVAVKPQKIEWKDGKLVCRCYVVNGMDRPIWVMGAQQIRVYSGNTEIARGRADIPQSEEFSIEPGKSDIEEFTLSGSEILVPNANLDNMHIDSLITYAWDDE